MTGPLSAADREELTQLRARCDTLTHDNDKLRRINEALMGRVERGSDAHGSAFALFETAITLDSLVAERTVALEKALSDLARVNLSLSEAKQAADAAEQRLRDAIESLNEGFALFDADDRLILCNSAYRNLWPEIADRIADGIDFAAILRLVAAHERPRGADLAPDRWLSDRLARHSVASAPHVQMLADGRFLQINELRTSEGGIVGIYTDITDTKTEEAAARSREALERNIALQAMFDSLSEGVCLFGDDDRLAVWNGAMQALLGEAGLLGLTRDAFAAALARRLAVPAKRFAPWAIDGVAAHADRVRARDGRRFDLRWIALPRGGGAFSVEDVTERENARTMLESRVAERTSELMAVNRRLSSEIAERTTIEDQLREAKTQAETANRSKTSFIAAASHDLLQPLNAARLFIAALQDRRLAPPTRALVGQTASALDSVDDLLEALLEISRLDAGAIQPEIGPVALCPLLSNLRVEFAPVAAGGGLRLSIPDTDIHVTSDVRLLRRVLQNLLSNALRYTAVGEVRLDITTDGDAVTLAVSDTGPGIAEEDREAIFVEFHRLSAHRRSVGKGLGLAIVQRAVTMLGHRLTLQSEIGRGSCFALTVPRAIAEAPVAIDSSPRRTADRAMQGSRILVVDNERSIADGMATLLGGWGCDVLIAATPEEAAATCAMERRIDLMIADYHLDDERTGLDAVRAVRDAEDRALPAMIISADRSPELRAALQAAEIPLLAKPVKPAQLRALMRTLLN